MGMAVAGFFLQGDCPAAQTLPDQSGATVFGRIHGFASF
jgi:hypothetical protein